ncbi:MAG: hypothetical protein KC503_22205 [Myxococcales bacterium]|nr:hypothetical protein [Myxococcales bacterium]
MEGDDEEDLILAEEDAAEGPTLINHERRSTEVAIVPGMPLPPEDESAPLAGYALAPVQDDSVPSLASLRPPIPGTPAGPPPTLLPDLGSGEQPMRIIPPAPLVPIGAVPRAAHSNAGSARRPTKSRRWIWIAAAGALVIAGGAVAGALLRQTSRAKPPEHDDLVHPAPGTSAMRRRSAASPATPAAATAAERTALEPVAPQPKAAATQKLPAALPRDDEPSSPRASLDDARQLLQRGHFKAAHEAFSALLAARGNNERARVGRARAAVELDLPEPLLGLEGSRQTDDEARLLRVRIAVRRALRDSASAPLAMHMLEGLPQSLRRRPRARLWRGQLLAATGRQRAARSTLTGLLVGRRRLRTGRTRFDTIVALSRVQLALGYKPAAKALAQRALVVAKQLALAPQLVRRAEAQLQRSERSTRLHP